MWIFHSIWARFQFIRNRTVLVPILFNDSGFLKIHLKILKRVLSELYRLLHAKIDYWTKTIQLLISLYLSKYELQIIKLNYMWFFHPFWVHKQLNIPGFDSISLIIILKMFKAILVLIIAYKYMRNQMCFKEWFTDKTKPLCESYELFSSSFRVWVNH